jgi:uncharacterized phage protein (TIGR02218 family)
MREVSEELEAIEVRTTRKPAEIYDFWNDQTTYRVTSADEIITYDGNDYEPAYIGRNRTGHNSQMTVSRLQINVDKLQPEVKSYLTAAPLDETWIRIMRVYRDQKGTLEAQIYFVGTIATVQVKGRAATLNCEGLERFMSQGIPRLRYQRLCPLSLYGNQCGVAKTSFDQSVTLSAIGSDLVTLTGTNFGLHADGYFNFGWLEWSGYRRMITSHVGTLVVLRHYIPDLTDTDTVVAYAGCDKTMSSCRDKFSNLNGYLDSYFGFPYLPYDNPALWT